VAGRRSRFAVWGTQNSPAFLLRRNVVVVMLAALDSPTDQALQDLNVDNKIYKFGTAKLKSGESVGLYFDPATKLLPATRPWIQKRSSATSRAVPARGLPRRQRLKLRTRSPFARAARRIRRCSSGQRR